MRCVLCCCLAAQAASQGAAPRRAHWAAVAGSCRRPSRGSGGRGACSLEAAWQQRNLKARSASVGAGSQRCSSVPAAVSCSASLRQSCTPRITAFLMYFFPMVSPIVSNGVFITSGIEIYIRYIRDTYRNVFSNLF